MDIMLLDLNQDVMGEIVSYLNGASLYCLRVTCKEFNKSIKKKYLLSDDIFRLFFLDLYTNFIQIYTYYPDEMMFQSRRKQRNIQINTDEFNQYFNRIPAHVNNPKKHLTVTDKISGHLFFDYGSGFSGRCRMGFSGNFQKGFEVGCVMGGDKQYINFIKY